MDSSSFCYLEQTLDATIWEYYLVADPREQVSEGGGIFLSVSATPEPSVWALMIAGIGVLGATLRFHRCRFVMAI